MNFQNEALTKFMNDVNLTLKELKKIDTPVSEEALKKSLDPLSMKEYFENMSVNDCASLLMELYN